MAAERAESARHLHRDDHPRTLAVLTALLEGRDAIDIGYEPTKEGAWVDWDALLASYLSSTEKAAVRVAHGFAVAERAGGFPPRVSDALTAAVTHLAR